MQEFSFLDQVRREGFTREQRSQLSTIRTYFGYFIKMKRQNPSTDYSKYFLTFAYNLWRLGLEPAAHLMLDQVNPSFYEHGLVKEMQRAHSFLLEAKNLKNKSDPHSIQRRHVCNTEGEFFLVALNMIGYLSELKDFYGRESFLRFVEHFNANDLVPV